MIYIYNCYGGTHSSVIAAQYHLKNLKASKVPKKEEILSLKNFNKLTKKDFGKLYFHGTDDKGNKVYTIGRGTSKTIIPSLIEITKIFQKEGGMTEKVIFSNTSPTVSLAMTLGGFLSRWLKIDFLGVPLLIKGVKQSYMDVVRLVDETKKIAQNNFEVNVLDNKEIKK